MAISAWLSLLLAADPVYLLIDVPTGRTLASSGAVQTAPGSTLKPFVLATLLDSPAFDPNLSLPCPRKTTLRGRRLDCTHPDLPALDARTALAYSCNHYFAEMARRLGPAQLRRGLARFGFSPQGDDPALLALGLDGIETTPAQLASAYRRLLARRAEPKLAPVFAGLQLAAETGTARLAAPPGLRVAGKTGTIPSPRRLSLNAWFAGYAPVDAPQVVLIVYVETGRGGADAAPAAREIFARWHAAPH